MNSRERILSALALKEPDIVPFADWIDESAKLNLVKIESVYGEILILYIPFPMDQPLK